MKHVVQRYWSTRIPNLMYSCPGFGDIVHSCLLTYLSGRSHGEPATLHIASHQNNRDTPQIWAEVLGLFPDGSVSVECHNTRQGSYTDRDFLHMVQQKYPDALLHYYQKYPGRLQQVIQPSFFVDEYMPKYARLPGRGTPQPLDLPEKFATCQVDASSKKRHLTPQQLQSIKAKFQDLGCEIITVGGQSQDPRLRTATYAGHAMSCAQYHIGVDSGYMHMAQMYFKPQNIYLYTNRPETDWEHHLKMARDHGCHINDY